MICKHCGDDEAPIKQTPFGDLCDDCRLRIITPLRAVRSGVTGDQFFLEDDFGTVGIIYSEEWANRIVQAVNRGEMFEEMRSLLGRIASGWGGTWGETPEHPSDLARALLARIEKAGS